MEKGIEVIMRYHWRDGYFVEVTHEKSALAGRDYWLCRRNCAKKIFMFSSNFKDNTAEQNLILKNIASSIRKYERIVPNELFA